MLTAQPVRWGVGRRVGVEEGWKCYALNINESLVGETLGDPLRCPIHKVQFSLL